MPQIEHGFGLRPALKPSVNPAARSAWEPANPRSLSGERNGSRGHPAGQAGRPKPKPASDRSVPKADREQTDVNFASIVGLDSAGGWHILRVSPDGSVTADAVGIKVLGQFFSGDPGWAGGLPVPLAEKFFESRDWGASRALSRSWRRFALIPALATVAAFGLLVGLARRTSSSPADWTAAIGVVAAAVALVVLRRRVTLGFAALGASAAVVAAAVTGGPGALDEAGGLECLLTVGITAAGAVAAARVVLRHEPREVLGSAMGAWAVSGALAAVGALQVACGARSSLAHLLTFHLGGLLAVTAVALLAARRHAAPARS